MKNLFGVLWLALMATLVSCGGGGGGGTGTGTGTGTGSGGTVIPPVDKVNTFVNLLNNRYLYDSNYYIVKRPEQTATEGFVVVYSADTGYVAYDMKNYLVGDTWGTYSSYAEFQPVYIHGTSYDSYSNETFYFGDAYQNNYYGSYAGEFVFDETTEAGKDLEKAHALIDAHKTGKIAEALASEFGLSEERGLRIAKLVSDWQKLSKSRSMTNADANIFTKELLGVDMKKAESAITKHLEGDDSEVAELVKKAAQVNGTGPEQMNELLTTIFVQQS